MHEATRSDTLAQPPSERTALPLRPRRVIEVENPIDDVSDAAGAYAVAVADGDTIGAGNARRRFALEYSRARRTLAELDVERSNLALQLDRARRMVEALDAAQEPPEPPRRRRTIARLWSWS